jgi:glycosyltransferase involved in cell wall biosynthesis
LPYVFSAEAFRDVPPPAEAGAGYVLVAGNLEYFKGFDLLMRGYDRYRERGGRLSLVFAGSAGRLDPDPHAQAMMRMSPVNEVLMRWGADSVRFLGRVSQGELAGWRAAANGVIVNSRFDAFTLVAGETALSGCPLLLSDRTGWRTQAAMCPGSCMFDPYDAHAVAAALDEAEDPRKRSTLMALSRQLAAMISGEALILKTVQFYSEAASGGKAASR